MAGQRGITFVPVCQTHVEINSRQCFPVRMACHTGFFERDKRFFIVAKSRIVRTERLVNRFCRIKIWVAKTFVQSRRIFISLHGLPHVAGFKQAPAAILVQVQERFPFPGIAGFAPALLPGGIEGLQGGDRFTLFGVPVVPFDLCPGPKREAVGLPREADFFFEVKKKTVALAFFIKPFDAQVVAMRITDLLCRRKVDAEEKK